MIWSGNVAYHDALEPLLIPIDSVQRHPDNYNEGDIEAIDESIEFNGFFDPISYQTSTRYILTGNHTWETCKLRGALDIPAIPLDVDDDTAIQIMIAHNMVARRAHPNSARLLALLRPKESVVGTGVTPRQIEVLEAIEAKPLRFETADWPTLTIRVPPEVRKAFFEMTEGAVGERERLEVLLRMAGWEG